LFDLRVNAYQATAILDMSMKFGVGSSSRLSFQAQTRTQSRHWYPYQQIGYCQHR